MDLGDLLVADGIIPSLKAKTKKQALQELAAKGGAVTGIGVHEIFEGLLQRERLGSTAFGRGIAIPHAKFKACKSIVCLFARLEKPVDFEALDGEPVDLVFLLLAPEHAAGDHLKALHRISRVVREPALLEALRAANGLADLREILTQPATSHAA